MIGNAIYNPPCRLPCHAAPRSRGVPSGRDRSTSADRCVIYEPNLNRIVSKLSRLPPKSSLRTDADAGVRPSLLVLSGG